MIYPNEQEARDDLAAAHQFAVYDGLAEGTWNHFSVMLDERTMLITPADRHWSRVTPASLVMAAERDSLPELPKQFWIGYDIHAAVHQARPDAIAALHVHPPYATALSLLQDPELIAASQLSSEFYGRISYSTVYDGVAGAGQGEACAEALGDKTVLIMRGHGVLVTGPSIAQAYLDLTLLELACRSQLLAMSSGRPLNPFSDEDIAALPWAEDPADARRHFEAMRDALEGELATA